VLPLCNSVSVLKSIKSVTQRATKKTQRVTENVYLACNLVIANSASSFRSEFDTSSFI
jgi:hypothetical protein